MPPRDFDLLQPHFVSVETTIHQVLIEADTPVDQLFFPEAGFVSVITEGARKIEVGLVGCEGLVGAAPMLLGDERTPYLHNVQAAGSLFGIGVEPLREAIDRSPPLRTLLLRYIQTLLVQTAETAFVNASFDIETRLARWLLMCQDRMGSDELRLTHEFLAMMLGVQRTSVTLALQSLEGTGVIRARRGRVEIRDRKRILAMAGDGYGVPEAEYVRLIESEAVAA